MLLVLMLIVGVVTMLGLVLLAIVIVGIRQEPPEDELARQAPSLTAALVRRLLGSLSIGRTSPRSPANCAAMPVSQSARASAGRKEALYEKSATGRAARQEMTPIGGLHGRASSGNAARRTRQGLLPAQDPPATQHQDRQAAPDHRRAASRVHRCARRGRRGARLTIKRWSEQLVELVRGHPDDGQDVPQCALGHVLARVDRDWDCAPIRMLHYVVAAVNPRNNEASALERLDYLRSRYGRDRARHKAGSYQKSGYVECQSQLVGWPDHVKQSLKRFAQVSDRLFLRRAIADRADARTELGRGAPDAVLVLLNDVGHVNGTSHRIDYHTSDCRLILKRLCRRGKPHEGRLGTS
jgi:hypothetical protein